MSTHRPKEENLESFSSFSSFGSIEDISPQEALEKEKLKSRRLEDRLAGYKSITKELSKLQTSNRNLCREKENLTQEKNLLEDKLLQLEQRNLSLGIKSKTSEGFTDLGQELAKHTNNNSSQNTESSQSFVVIKQPTASNINSALEISENYNQKKDKLAKTENMEGEQMMKSGVIRQKSEILTPVYKRDNPFSPTTAISKPFGIFALGATSSCFEAPKLETEKPEVKSKDNELGDLSSSYSYVQNTTSDFTESQNAHVSSKDQIKAHIEPAGIQTKSNFIIGNEVKVSKQSSDLFNEFNFMSTQNLKDPSDSPRSSKSAPINSFRKADLKEGTNDSAAASKGNFFSLEKHHKILNPSDDLGLSLNKSDGWTAVHSVAENLSEERTNQFAKDAQVKITELQMLLNREGLKYSKLQEKNKELQSTICDLREELHNLKEENRTLSEMLSAGVVREEEILQLKNRRAEFPDDPRAQRVEQLQTINAKLFAANKDWYNKWEEIRHCAQAEREKLEQQMDTLADELQFAKSSRVEAIQNLNKELTDLKKSNLAIVEKNTILEKQLDEEKRKSETTKENLIQENRKLISELESCKRRRQGSVDLRDTPREDLETEITVLKQQVTYFMEDFDRERKDRLTAESKLDKLGKERDEMKITFDRKLKSAHAILKTKDEELRLKSRSTAQLQFQLDKVKEQLQKEQKKNLVRPTSPVHENPVSRPFSLFSNEDESASDFPREKWEGTGGSFESPEKFPGAWTCGTCTYINYPTRTVCEICGSRTDGNRLLTEGDHNPNAEGIFHFDIEKD